MNLHPYGRDGREGAYLSIAAAEFMFGLTGEADNIVSLIVSSMAWQQRACWPEFFGVAAGDIEQVGGKAGGGSRVVINLRKLRVFICLVSYSHAFDLYCINR